MAAVYSRGCFQETLGISKLVAMYEQHPILVYSLKGMYHSPSLCHYTHKMNMHKPELFFAVYSIWFFQEMFGLSKHLDIYDQYPILGFHFRMVLFVTVIWHNVPP